jgi:hypothetical protein
LSGSYVPEIPEIAVPGTVLGIGARTRRDHSTTRRYALNGGLPEDLKLALQDLDPLQNRENPRLARKAHESKDRGGGAALECARVSELPTPRELGQVAGRMLADELACYQEEKRAGIVVTGVVPQDVRVDVEARLGERIEMDPTAFWEGFVEAIRTTDVSKWLRE